MFNLLQQETKRFVELFLVFDFFTSILLLRRSKMLHFNMLQMKTHWLLYVEKMDKVLEEAFRQCVKCSLQSLLDHLVGDGTAGPTPLIAVATFLKNNKVCFYLYEFSINMFLAGNHDYQLRSFSPA